ncbi:mechanosensitive ion channel family protein [Flavobacteriaceae bacterium]|jgi:miniconductance mechanosensitive channel|nr:mechanosensitive ion channel family protein [Flavobacteriaceae bacterium]|tara:strand:+ start:1045 stop:2292 length:1248 start_codon:yes stop_codon:yes gene_type:complete
MEENRFFYDFLMTLKFPEFYAEMINLIVLSLVVLLTSILLNFLSKKIISNFFVKLSSKTTNNFDDYLISNRAQIYISKLIPVLFIYWVIPFWLMGFESLINYTTIFIEIYFILLIIWIIRSFLRSGKDYLKTIESLKDKPIESFVQVCLIVVWFLGILIIFSLITGKEISTFLTAMGALSAVILLIFKDTILGFVASIQLSANDLIRIGDWITMEKYGADGDVIEINLNSVKIQNFDKTITTIPTYKLISDSFKNWRGMSDSNVRRIKRALLIKGSSIKFLSKNDLNELKKIKLIEGYIIRKEKEISEYNFNLKIDDSSLVNGRSLTNLGLYRVYIEEFLDKNPSINSEMTLMCRQLTPTSQGVPLEIYAFSKDQDWKKYEDIMSDIFDHLLASLKTFHLELFELPSSLNNKVNE